MVIQRFLVQGVPWWSEAIDIYKSRCRIILTNITESIIKKSSRVVSSWKSSGYTASKMALIEWITLYINEVWVLGKYLGPLLGIICDAYSTGFEKSDNLS